DRGCETGRAEKRARARRLGTPPVRLTAAPLAAEQRDEVARIGDADFGLRGELQLSSLGVPRASGMADNQWHKAHVPGAVRWTRLFTPLAAHIMRGGGWRGGSASFAKKSGNTFRHADKLGQRWRRWRLDISTHTASTSLE